MKRIKPISGTDLKGLRNKRLSELKTPAVEVVEVVEEPVVKTTAPKKAKPKAKPKAKKSKAKKSEKDASTKKTI